MSRGSEWVENLGIEIRRLRRLHGLGKKGQKSEIIRAGWMEGWMTDRRHKKESGTRNEEFGNRKKTMNENLGLRFRYTWDIIDAAERGLLPDKIMLNIHPQRLTDRPLPWIKEFVGQNVKNVIKRYFYVRR